MHQRTKAPFGVKLLIAAVLVALVFAVVNTASAKSSVDVVSTMSSRDKGFDLVTTKSGEVFLRVECEGGTLCFKGIMLVPLKDSRLELTPGTTSDLLGPQPGMQCQHEVGYVCGVRVDSDGRLNFKRMQRRR